MDFENNFSSIGSSNFECNSFDESSCNQENNSEEYNCNYLNSSNRINLNIQSDPLQPRRCPICNENYSITPNTGQYECLRCGYKPLPLRTNNYPMTERSIEYNENLTAEDILKEWDDEIKKINSCQRKHYPSETRCKCADNLDKNKLCAYCRIKVNCQELFENISKNINNEMNFMHDTKLSNKTNQENQTKNDNSTSIVCKDILDKRPKSILKTQSELEELRKIYGWSDKKKSIKRSKRKIQNFSKKFDKSFKDNEIITRTIYEKDRPKCANLEKQITSANIRDNIRKRAKRLRKRLRRRRNHRNFYVPTSLPKINNTRHMNCIRSVRVPNNMGWLWTVFTKENDKWRPGYIPKRVRELMLHFIRPIDVLPMENVFYKSEKCYSRPTPEIPVQKPTLHIKRINGDYIITMQPLKDPKLLSESADPYLDVEPIRFKILRQPITVKRHEIKEKLKEKGFEICKCQQPISKCKCRTFIEKQRLEKEVINLCQDAGIKDLRDELHFSDVTDNENDIDIDFTPPVGLVKCDLMRKPDAVVKETQYDPSDYDKPEPYESPFKISHPNYKEPSTLKKLTTKTKNAKELSKDKKQKTKSAIHIGKSEEKKLGRSLSTGKNTGKRRENIDKNAKKIGSKSKSSDQVPDNSKNGKTVNAKKTVSDETGRKDNKQRSVPVGSVKSRLVGKNDGASGDKLKKDASRDKLKQAASGDKLKQQTTNKKGVLGKSIENLSNEEQKYQKIGDTSSVGKYKRRKGVESKLSNTISTTAKNKKKTEMGYISGTEINIETNGSRKKLTTKEKEKGWNPTVRIPTKPKLKPVNPKMSTTRTEDCNDYNYLRQNFICNRLPESMPVCSNTYTDSYPVSCAQEMFNNCIQTCGKLYG